MCDSLQSCVGLCRVFLTSVWSVCQFSPAPICLSLSLSENALKPLLSIYKHAVKAVLLKSTSVVSSDCADLKILHVKKLFASSKAILVTEKRITVGNAAQTIQSKFQATPRETNKTTSSCS